jgi:nucleoside-diphosphate-sugar epimerase
MGFYEGKNVLVTGGAGFIGSNLVEALVAAGAHVRVADSLARGRLEFLGNVRDNIEFLELNLQEYRHARKAVEKQDIVFHLAALVGGIDWLLRKQSNIAWINAVMDQNLIRAAVEAGVERFMETSTACVYGKEAPLPCKEEAAGGTYDSMYGRTKHYFEFVLKEYMKDYGIRIAIVRCFNVYGPRESFDRENSHVIPALVHKAVDRDDPFVVFGTGEQARSFIYVDDVVRGMMDITEKYAEADPINFGTPESVKIKDLARKILRLTGHNPRMDFDTTKPEGVHDRCADIMKAKEILGWTPTVDFETGLQRTIEWFKENRELFWCENCKS